MEPQLEELDLCTNCLLMRSADALEDLAHVTQVESVVRLVRRWLQPLLHTSVDNFRGLNKLTHLILHIRVESAEEAAKDLGEDHRD